jgi:tetratricopeptide (TPR) repeat protein
LFKKAEDHFRVALKRATLNYTHPRDGEAYYYLGLALRFQDRYDAAYDAFYKATWSHAFHTAAYHQLAELDCLQADFATALAHVDRAIGTNTWANRLLNLKSAILRHMGQPLEAQRLSSSVVAADPLDLWAASELQLAHSAQGMVERAADDLDTLRKRMRGDVQCYLELAVDYGNCGLWNEAIGVLSLAADSGEEGLSTFPMVYYYLGHYHDRKGEREEASRYLARAGEMPANYCFPFRPESIEVLRRACERNPNDARAPYYLGNLLYEHQPEEAIREWERARELDDAFPTVHRNLGVAYSQVRHDADEAFRSLRQAIACDDQDPRLFFELDVFAEAAGVPAEHRLELLRTHHTTIVNHNDAFTREVILLTQLGHYDEAIRYMRSHHFRKWEGVGNIHDTYVDAHLLRGRQHLKAGRHEQAVRDFRAALEYPENLEVARPYHGGRDCQVYCLLGRAYEASGEAGKAELSYETAASLQVGHRAELRYYRGLALRKLGREEEAIRLFDELLEVGKEQLEQTEATDFFAKFGEQIRRERRMANAHYLMALGYSGKGQRTEARAACERALELHENHLWAQVQFSDLQ